MPPANRIDELTQSLIRERPDLDLTNLLLAIYLQSLGRIIEQDFERHCARTYRMRAADVRILIVLWRSPPSHAARPTDLFRGLYLSSGAITKQVDRLVAKRLVRRVKDPAHRGGALIKLTAGGHKLAADVIGGIASGRAVCPEMVRVDRKTREAALKFCFGVLSAVESSADRSRLHSRSKKAPPPA